MSFDAALTDFNRKFAQVENPQDFVRPDGSYDMTPENLGDADFAEAIREYQRSLRECRPANPAVEDA